MSSLTPELYDLIVRIVEDKVKDIKVTREEFDKLRRTIDERLSKLEEAITRLTEAQKRTEERIGELAQAQRKTEERIEQLAQAQKRTEDRLNTLAERLNALAEAQRRTEERIEQLAQAQRRTEERLNALAEAQRKTEERLNALAEAQKKTEERLNALAEAQRRTEERIEQLAQAQKKTEDALSKLMAEVEKLAIGLNALRIEVGRLSETIGFGLEDIARVVVPGWLHRHLGVEVDELRREFFKVDEKEIEVNLYGEGTLRGEEVVIIGEVKSRIYKEDVEKFYNQIYAPITGKIEKKTIGLLFGYLVHPTARKRAEELGLHTIASYER